MATETFFKKIVINKEAAEIMAAELEKEKEPYIPEFDAEEVERNTKQWLERYRSKKSSAQQKMDAVQKDKTAQVNSAKTTMILLAVALIALFAITACTNKNNTDNRDNPETDAATSATPPEDNKDMDNIWTFYNERAEAFVTAMANGDFEAATAMFDPTMKRALPEAKLENDVWNVVIEQAGAFIGVHEIENSLVDGYYVCFTTSRHEIRGVTLRVVFSENGLVSGLFIDGYQTIAGDIAQREGFTEYPIVIGEGTDFPLHGILSMPDNVSGKIPAVVLVHGSGAQDMNETIYENKPFLDIAEYLASNGIAVIRYDKRTFTHWAKITEHFGGGATIWEETIEDAILATAILKSDPRIDENKVFMLGHSLGGMLAPRIHAEGGNFAGIISLAGSPRTLLEISYDQTMALINEMPESAEKTAALSQMETYDEQIQALMNLSDDDAKNTPMSGGVSFYYYKEMEEKPVFDYLQKIQIPFLIIQGEKDFQVYADKDYVLWQELLAGRSNATFKLYDGLNHFFMKSTGKNIAEFQEEYKVASHVDSRVLLDIVEWIKSN